MEHFFLFLLKATIAIFVILNPFGNVPVLFSLTPDLDKTGRRTVITKASLTALFVLLLFAVTGQLVFDFFHITIGAFRIAGGAVLAAIDRLTAGKTVVSVSHHPGALVHCTRVYRLEGGRLHHA